MKIKNAEYRFTKDGHPVAYYTVGNGDDERVISAEIRAETRDDAFDLLSWAGDRIIDYAERAGYSLWADTIEAMLADPTPWPREQVAAYWAANDWLAGKWQAACLHPAAAMRRTITREGEAIECGRCGKVGADVADFFEPRDSAAWREFERDVKSTEQSHRAFATGH